ncbi:MAG: hypothetical protein QNI96_15050 [Woeseiaceae bacterium]|nr:hypothetical protein [Woeseiaceae bacterium]
MKLVIAMLLAAVGIVHLVPVSGMLGNDALAKLYGITITSPDLEILMRHRAVLFGIVGGLLIASAFVLRLQAVALVAGLLSIVSFLWIATTVGGYGPAIARVIQVDIAAVVALGAAGGCRLYLNLSG